MKRGSAKVDLDVLLDRGGLGTARREAILESVLETVVPARPPRWRWRWSFAGWGVAAAAAATALFVVVSRPAPPSTPTAGLRAKGASPASAVAPGVTVECLSGTLASCESGSLLVVGVHGARGYLSAWAEPVSGGERIWYFSAESSAPWVDGVATQAAIASRAVKLGPEHQAASYAVEIRLTDRPMARDELLRLPASAALAAGHASLTVIRR